MKRLLLDIADGVTDGLHWLADARGGMVLLISIGVTSWMGLVFYLVSS